MQRFLLLLAIFLLGVGSSQLSNWFVARPPQPSTRPVEVTSEATSSSITGGEANSEYRVIRVIDGDTIELEGGKRTRYIGVDTPEIVDPTKPVECFGREASDENKKLVEGKMVRLEKDISETDRYGRLLRYVYVGDVLVNDALVRQGFAHSSTFPPDVKYQQKFMEAEREARENNRGLWAGCSLTNGSGSGLNLPVGGSQGQTPSGDSSVLSGLCVIKGNISSGGEKIYHVPGCGSYDKTVIDEGVGERWFCTEEDALKAGWRKAKNC